MQARAEVLAPALPCPGPFRAAKKHPERCRACGKCGNVLRLLAVEINGEDPAAGHASAQPAASRH